MGVVANKSTNITNMDKSLVVQAPAYQNHGRLRESIDAGGTELPVDEKRLTRARRAVEKAANILREPDDTLD